MEISNNTPFEVIALPLEGPEARPVLMVVVKGTFDIQAGAPATVASEQIPVAYCDEFHDVMGTGSVKFESDIAPFKPRADIALVGKAYAPGGQPAQVVHVMLRVGHVKKTIRVFGDRHWRCAGRLLPEHPSDPKPFVTMDLVYERAFGGIDMEGGGYCAQNLVGRGFVSKKSKKVLDGAPLPNLEDPDNLIKSWKDRPKPVGFGFYGKAWMPRLGYLEAYNNQQKQKSASASPGDFSFNHHNGAHPDLQLDGYLKGDEEVELVNLTPEGKTRFQLPGIKLSCTVTKSLGLTTDLGATYGEDERLEGTEVKREFENPHQPPSATEKVELNLDTLCLIPDEQRLYLVWRGLCPIYNLSAAEVKILEIY
ncbi:MAG: DUF2169 domain-containing protein [Deltaproteobacteria bacterium]|nr:DUF2169 domain-containing protein [Deltaproteobacteria bacterium]